MKEYKNPCKLSLINTTCGMRYLIVTCSKSKEFKTLKGAENWANKNNYKNNDTDIYIKWFTISDNLAVIAQNPCPLLFLLRAETRKIVVLYNFYFYADTTKKRRQ